MRQRRWGVVRTVTALLALAGCADAGPEPILTVGVTPPTSTVASGSTVSLSATPMGKKAALSGRVVTWSSSNATLANVSSSGIVTAGTVTANAPESAVITATAEGISGTASISVLPAPVTTVTVRAVSTGTVRPGQRVPLEALLAGAAGQALTGRTVAWSSSDSTVATVEPTGTLVVRGYAGALTRTVTVTATSESRSGTLNVSVLPSVVASLSITGSTPVLTVGQRLTLGAVVRDSTGSALTERLITWSSASPTIATVSSSGEVVGVTAGQAVVTATSEGQSTSVTVIVSSATGPTITAIAPAQLSAGLTATISGVRFAETLAGNTVTLGGIAATVLTASSTQLTVRVPCTTSGRIPVVVTSAGERSTAFNHAMSVNRITLTVGQSTILTNSTDASCNELASAGGAARYLVTVFSAATNQNTLMDIALGGNPGAAAVFVPSSPARLTARDLTTAMTSTDLAHWQHLERERARYAEMRAMGPLPTATVRARNVALPSVGDMRSFSYNFRSCGDTTTFRGKAIYIGSRAIIWEDSANTLQSAATPTLAEYYDRLGRIFDRDQYESVRRTFGDPLLRDPLTDGDGRLHMVFTQQLNGTGAAAYVTSCDQFPKSRFAASNFGEYFYATVPTTATLNVGSTASPDGWFYFMARTVVHEVKHIASMAARVANNAPVYEQSWLEEGTARHAEEVWIRDSLHRVPWKGNTGWGTPAGNGVVCDFSPNNATCLAADPLRRPSFGMRRQLHEIRPKMLEPWNWSPFGDGTGQSGSVFYNTVWSLVRYTIDRYGSSDQAFLTALNNATTSGTANLTAVAGTTWDRLIGGWGLTLYADDFPGLPAGNSDVAFPTWNLRSIYAGLSGDPTWRTSYPNPYPLQPVPLTFGAFSATRTGIRGAAHAYFELSGTQATTQLLRLTAPDGGTVSTSARLAILRLP